MSGFFESATSGATLFEMYPCRSAALSGSAKLPKKSGSSYEEVAIAALSASQLSLEILIKQQPWFPVRKMRCKLEEALIAEAKARRKQKMAPRRLTFEEVMADMEKQARAFRSLRATCVQPLFPYLDKPFLDLSQASDQYYTKLCAFDQ